MIFVPVWNDRLEELRTSAILIVTALIPNLRYATDADADAVAEVYLRSRKELVACAPLVHSVRVASRMTVYYAHLDQIVSTTLLSELDRDGFAIVSGVVDDSLRLDLLRDVGESVSSAMAGIRGVTRKIESLQRLAQSAGIRALVEPVLGPEARLVHSILFNKNEDALPSSMRGVVLRTSFVLGKNGGALRQLSRVVRFACIATLGQRQNVREASRTKCRSSTVKNHFARRYRI